MANTEAWDNGVIPAKGVLIGKKSNKAKAKPSKALHREARQRQSIAPRGLAEQRTDLYGVGKAKNAVQRNSIASTGTEMRRRGKAMGCNARQWNSNELLRHN